MHVDAVSSRRGRFASQQDYCQNLFLFVSKRQYLEIHGDSNPNGPRKTLRFSKNHRSKLLWLSDRSVQVVIVERLNRCQHTVLL